MARPPGAIRDSRPGGTSTALGLSLLAFCLSGFLSTEATAAAAPFTVQTNSIPEWVVRHQGRTVFSYAFGPGRFKPHVRELATIEGRNLLRDAPSDHLHHHALMYAIRVNGINFWEEIPGSGVQKPVETTTSLSANPDGGVSRATLSQTLHWVTAENAFLPDTTSKALLSERRTLTLTWTSPDRKWPCTGVRSWKWVRPRTKSPWPERTTSVSGRGSSPNSIRSRST